MTQRSMILGCAGAALAVFGSMATAQDYYRAPVMGPSGDWTGTYAGGQIGWGWASGDAKIGVDGTAYDADVDGSGGNYGVSIGYRHDMGTWVAGAEAAFDWSNTHFEDVDVGLDEDVDDAGKLKDVIRYVGLLGYDAGQVLYYGQAGWARGTVKSDNGYSEDGGFVLGGGADYMLTEHMTIGGQLLYYNFDDMGDEEETFNLGVTRLQVKATYRF